MSGTSPRHHRLSNRLHSALLLLGMAVLFAACGWAVAGVEGILWGMILGGVSLGFGARIPPHLMLRLSGAVPLSRHEAPDVYRVFDGLVARAGLEKPPALFKLSSRHPVAFSVGHREDAGITLSTSLLRALSLREITGVLAHELSHVRHNDMWIMGLASVVNRLTRTMSFLGVLLLVLNLPLIMTGTPQVPWLLVMLLIFAPTIASLLQLALSRTREFDADLDAAALTGDPMGLASALETLERSEGRAWENLVPRPPRQPEPSLLRTHPKTGERIRRLRALSEAGPVHGP